MITSVHNQLNLYTIEKTNLADSFGEDGSYVMVRWFSEIFDRPEAIYWFIKSGSWIAKISFFNNLLDNYDSPVIWLLASTIYLGKVELPSCPCFSVYEGQTQESTVLYEPHQPYVVLGTIALSRNKKTLESF